MGLVEPDPCPCEPGGDDAERARADEVHPAAPIEHHRQAVHEARRPKGAKLACRGRAADAQLVRDHRGPPRAEGEQRHDPQAERIGEQRDP